MRLTIEQLTLAADATKSLVITKAATPFKGKFDYEIGQVAVIQHDSPGRGSAILARYRYDGEGVWAMID